MSHSDLVDWLLKAETPSIRYLTARDLMGLPNDDPQVAFAQQAVMTDGIVPAIFAKQTPSGQWANEPSYYSPKYVSTHWSLLLLSELGVDPADERFQRGIDYMLTATTQSTHRHFKLEGKGFACLWGNVLRYVLYAGRADDARTQVLTDYVVQDVMRDNCHCRANSNASCAWGVVRALWALAALPEIGNHSDLQAAVDQGLRFLLDSFSLVEANYPTADNGKIHPLWFKLNFPLFYQSDILFTLRVLSELDALQHPGAAAALDWLEAQRQADGHWHGDSPFRQRTWRKLGNAEETARWVSLQAALILQKAGRFEDSKAA